jgi:hypothetical protein
VNFADLTDPIAIFDGFMRTSLPALYGELLSSDCYVREHEVVNLFVFGHLVPLFQAHDLDLRQIGIEYPVTKLQSSAVSKPRARKDLVIWPKVGATLWNGFAPLAIVEWKHISMRTDRPLDVRSGYRMDIEWLKQNRDRMRVGFAVLVERRSEFLSLECVRVQDVEQEFLRLPIRAAAVG